MFYERELQFLSDTFKKCRIPTSVISPKDKPHLFTENSFKSIENIIPALSRSIEGLFGSAEPYTLYKYCDDFKINYIMLKLPESPYDNVLLIGPFLVSALSSRQILEIGEKKNVPPKNQRILEEFYINLPIMGESSHLYLLLDTFCERIWGSASYSVVDVHKDRNTPVSPINLPSAEDFDDIDIKMKAMEQRYNYENEFMQAVSLGHIHRLNELVTAFIPDNFEMRTADPIRNLKNYCIIMNTLLRKAAERGGVHPIYLDSVSSSLAIRTEQLSSHDECANHMKEMFRSYCRLVRKHSMKDLSSIVQKTIILIDSDLSANLTLSALAENQKVSAGYLSTIFKKETGKTVTEYIREKRMKHAAYLLSTTRLQIQTIALHCGIMDLQYFSKTFKKHTGKTPKEYREFMKQSSI